MPSDESPRPKGFLRAVVPYLTVLVIIAAIYCGWTLYARWQSRVQDEQAIQEKKARADASIAERLGNGSLKIVAFYADPGIIRRGEKGLICYSVANAATVEIEPGVEPVKPSLSRCVTVAPTKDTHYTLTAKDASGHAKKAVTDVKVQ